ncbi:unnamed protein product [Owenia fusiformis]|uniref:Uncharacterized protein n=1 Tax=Owenia fusiformis TaxID=6347 RepID=A0A8S4PGI3_OWEFU|nr:unnamed protein product [Owenia fusiformis]
MGRMSKFKPDYLVTGALDGSNYYAAIGTTSKQIRARNMAETVSLMTTKCDLERQKIVQARKREREIRELEKQLLLKDRSDWLKKLDDQGREHGWDEDDSMKYMIGEILKGQMGISLKKQLFVNAWMPNILNKYCVYPLFQEGSLTSIETDITSETSKEINTVESKSKQKLTRTNKQQKQNSSNKNRQSSIQIFNKKLGSYETLPPIKTLQRNLKQRKPRSYKQLRIEQSSNEEEQSRGSVDGSLLPAI